MRKLQEYRRRALIKHARLSLKRKLRCRRATNGEPKQDDDLSLPNNSTYITYYREGYSSKIRFDGVKYSAPAELSLKNNYDKTIEFVANLRTHLREKWVARSKLHIHRKAIRRANAKPKIDAYFDFASVTRITSEVALLIAAEYHTVVRSHGWNNGVIDLEKWDKKVVEMLDGIGFFEIVGVERPSQKLILSGHGWKMLRFRSGTKAEGAIVHDLLSNLGVPEVINEPRLWEAIVEAITNTVNHAYPPDQIFDEPHSSDWWMTGFVVPQERRVSISVFDRGVTIPRTLPSWERYPIYQRGFRRLVGRDPDPYDTAYDGTAIAVAMAVGRSSTKDGYRGQGLPMIEATLDICQSGSLRVHSRKGSYERVRGAKPRTFNRDVSLEGTLVTWDWTFGKDV